MDGIHDLGGMHGFGAVVEPGGEAPYHQRWEPRVMALHILLAVPLTGRRERRGAARRRGRRARRGRGAAA
jgi:hypothetical protein